MNDVTTHLKTSVLRLMDEIGDGARDPRPPASYHMASIEIMAMSVFENNRVLTAWMTDRGLDPQKGQDALLGLGLLVAIDDKNFPRPEYEHFDYPDDHDH